MAFLYIGPTGVPWRKHSYSAGLDFATSPNKYYLRRVLGWKQADNKAAFKFGRALESAIQFFHESRFEKNSGINEFVRLWEVFKEEKDITFTKKEKDWANLLRIGKEMLRLYEIKQPSLPLTENAVFQREYSKEVFPNDPNYGEIEDAGKIDLISYPSPDHPLLPKLDWRPEYGLVRPVIVDIKTSGVNYTDIKGEAAFDAQLRRYAWLSGIYTVAFTWFTKSGHRMVKGSSVTLLDDAEEYLAGEEAVVANVQKDGGIYIVRSDFFVEEMEKAQGRKKNEDGTEGALDTTKDATARKDLWLAQNAVLVKPEQLTRQRLQWNCGMVTPESADDAGYTAADQIVSIVNSWKRKRWPNNFKPRPGMMDVHDPYYIAFVRGDEMYRKQNFKQVIDDEFDLFAEDEPAEGTDD
jgi:hypothetical protein